jgi:hypothetical protein
MYSPPMRPTRNYILAFACVSFLMITLSGFHLHADVGAQEESVSHAHDHHQVPSYEQDHEAEHIDISVFEPARGFSKVDTVALVIAVPERVVAPPIVQICSSKHEPGLVPKRFSRMRQPLRGPPISI